ncbi:unnamed protein product [Kluyveromyces dobzhanskii CBS 2104]|uniref:Inheritance of peroxisomes protein 1 n=1 Tax=Kluyveromyces dobzhanskii CBS 2104 TaxID=1427455 RepID=A0A0A8L9L3_9SACH|nr:unnamed protein product [Kluyveromyces dobzhanskii CBS 2104]
MATMESPKKKSSGPIQLLKNSLLRNKGQHSHLPSRGSQGKSNNIKRKSVQRITLFRYDNVKVRSWPSNNPENINVISSKTSFEIYEVDMGNAKQRTNYLSLGRKDQFVHPILPKLKIERIVSNTDSKRDLKIVISLFNPERFWEVTFLSIGNEHVTDKVITGLGTVLSKICQYNDGSGESRERQSTNNSAKAAALIPAQEEEETDELAYLLNDVSPFQELVSETESLELNESSTLSSISVESSMLQSGAVINETFKQALGRIKPVDVNTRVESTRYKRFSSLHSTFLDVSHKDTDYRNFSREKRRSISVPTSMNCKSISDLDSSNGVDFKKYSWMDVSFEDISEI